MFARRRLPCSDMACGLLTVPICRHYNKSMFAMRLAHGTHVPTPDEVHVRLSLAYLLTHAMRPAHGTRLPTTDTAPISRRLLCSHGLRLAHGTRLPTLRKRSRSPPCSHAVCLAHGPIYRHACSVIGFFCDSFQITKCHVMSPVQIGATCNGNLMQLNLLKNYKIKRIIIKLGKFYYYTACHAVLTVV